MFFILITLIGIIAVWMRVYKTYKTCYTTHVNDRWSDTTITKATLKQFKDIYYISPNKFTLKDRFPCYGEKYSDVVTFQFRFIDWLKYLIWKDNVKREKQREETVAILKKRQEKDNKILKEMYESLLHDIEETRKQGEKYVEEAHNTTKEVSERLKRERG